MLIGGGGFLGGGGKVQVESTRLGGRHHRTRGQAAMDEWAIRILPLTVPVSF